MKTIVFVNEKGGVGKTRLSDELYYYYKRQGLPISLYSFDGQYKNRTADKKSANPDVAVVDTPGRLMDDKTIKTIEGADVVVVPTMNSKDNMEQTKRTISIVQAHTDVPILLIVNGCDRYTETDMFMEWANHFAGVSNLAGVLAIPHSTYMKRATNNDCSVMDVNPYAAVTKAVQDYCDKVSELAGLPKEARKVSKKLAAVM